MGIDFLTLFLFLSLFLSNLNKFIFDFLKTIRANAFFHEVDRLSAVFVKKFVLPRDEIRFQVPVTCRSLFNY